MNITSAQYCQNVEGETIAIRIILDGVTDRSLSVPLDPANRHYAEIMRQVEAGELTIEPAETE